MIPELKKKQTSEFYKKNKKFLVRFLESWKSIELKVGNNFRF